MDAEHIGKYLTRRTAKAGGGAGLHRLWLMLTLFEAIVVPEIPVADYAARLLQGACLFNADGTSPEGTLALILLERFAANAATLTAGAAAARTYVTHSNAHRLFLAALLVATKFINDGAVVSPLPKLSALGGVPPRELGQLEVALLLGLSFDIVVSPAEYECFSASNRDDTNQTQTL
eukprot:TRINITY_DN392_c0_g2_i1.p1 TRINITY_DN392_c0_g2~~TRINITY_DN392_c0_g2_i1.p1  ORF type:complete len:177 (+),score=54.13 TRINITY_DN392_c0_g2_i1:104-634(+)